MIQYRRLKKYNRRFIFGKCKKIVIVLAFCDKIWYTDTVEKGEPMHGYAFTYNRTGGMDANEQI
jgi:hypothetical protein